MKKRDAEQCYHQYLPLESVRWMLVLYRTCQPSCFELVPPESDLPFCSSVGSQFRITEVQRRTRDRHLPLNLDGHLCDNQVPTCTDRRATHTTDVFLDEDVLVVNLYVLFQPLSRAFSRQPDLLGAIHTSPQDQAKGTSKKGATQPAPRTANSTPAKNKGTHGRHDRRPGSPHSLTFDPCSLH